MSGIFITFEGTEGAGKTTQIGRLARRLNDLRYHVREYREPGGTRIGTEIRNLLKDREIGQSMTPETEYLLFSAARAQLVRERIRPDLQAGRVVLCDRFYDSSLAYQMCGRGLDGTDVRRIIDFAVGGTNPDMTILLRVPYEVSLARRKQRTGTDRIEEAGEQFFRLVERGFDCIAETQPTRVKVVDATLFVEQVESAIWEQVKNLF